MSSQTLLAETKKLELMRRKLELSTALKSLREEICALNLTCSWSIILTFWPIENGETDENPTDSKSQGAEKVEN
jgi:hypothetical protein